jgi:hypothetical protein
VTEFRVERPIWTDSVEIYGRVQIGDEVKAIVAKGIEFIPAPKQGLMWPKFLDIPMPSEIAQSLFDALWHAGFRPNKGEASIAHVEAMREHLQDMRMLVFNLHAQRRGK